MLGNLGRSLSKTMKKLAGMTIVDEEVVREVIKDIQRALIQSDVNVKLVFKLSKSIENRALNEEPPRGITPKEHIIRIVYEEMVKLVGEKAQELSIDEKPYRILFLGLQGSGKTTTIGKLARHLRRRGFTVGVVCTDTWRPAAFEQLKQYTEGQDIDVYGDPRTGTPWTLQGRGLKNSRKRMLSYSTLQGGIRRRRTFSMRWRNSQTLSSPMRPSL